MAIFRNFNVNRRNRLCGLQQYASVQLLDFLELSKNCSFLDRKLINALHETADGHELRELPAPYNGILGHENEAVRLQNEDYWEKSVWITI
ncbi:MAG: hypothetical protein WBO84_00100 [Acidimicrobiia bacterium]